MKRPLMAFGVLVALLATFALGATSASADYSVRGVFAGGGSGPGGSGSEPGQLLNPWQADVSDVTGLLYVVDSVGSGRIQAFEPTLDGGRYAFTAANSEEGMRGLAVDKAADDVYAASIGGTFPARVFKYDGSLSKDFAWPGPEVGGPLAVDPTNGDVLVADQDANLIHRVEADGTLAGSFAAERPLDVAVNSSGEIFVVTSTGDLLGCATSSVQRFSAGGTAEGTVGASLVAPSAVAIDPDNDQILVAANTNGYNCGGPDPEVAVFDAGGEPLQSISLADTQYATVSGLAVQGGESGRAYVVTKSPAGDGFGKTKVIALEDDAPARPVVRGQTATPSADGAELQAAINPRFAATEYRFEYGLTAAYGNTTPGANLPAVGEELVVASTIAGLQPDTVYHYRVVAENSVGTATGPDRSFRTQSVPAGTDTCSNASLRALQGSAYLPDCRAYEMVSPVEKNAGTILWGAGGPPSVGLNATTADGETVAYNSYQPFPQSEHGQPQSYRASRTASGWQTIPVTPTPVGANPTVFDRVFLLDATDDFSTSIFETRENFDPLDQDELSFPGFRITFPDVYRRTDGEAVEWISRADADVPDAGFNEAAYVGRSADASTVYFRSTESLTPDAAPMVENVNYLYARGPDGTKLINTDEGGGLLSQCGASLGTYFTGGSTTRNAVSEDGQRAFFQVPDGQAKPAGQFDPSCLVPPQLYLRDGSTVTNVSASQMADPDPIVSGATFQAATADGSTVFFSSGDRLTDDATVGGGLYAFDVESGELSFLSTGAGPGGAEVRGVVKSTDDGSHVYFIAKGQLDGSEGTAGENNLYLWTPGSVRFVATLTEADASQMLEVEGYRPARITPDGSRLLFLSRVDQTDYEAEGTVQAYLWSEDGGTMRCASCDPAGNPPSGDATLLSAAGFFLPTPEQHDSRNLSEDGSRVFFETTAALVKGDLNGAVDVYGYSPGGVPRLISDGRAKFGSLFYDASSDGRDVFFATQASLVSEDVDNGENDIYDARVGGGFLPAPAPPDCAGEACQGPSSSSPPATTIGSGALDAPRSNPHTGRLLGSIAKRVSGSTVTLRVRVGGAGRVSASGLGLGRAAKSARKAGTYALKLSLDRGARARLEAKGRLGVRVVVRFAPAEGRPVRRSTTVVFRAGGCTQNCTNADRGVRG